MESGGVPQHPALLDLDARHLSLSDPTNPTATLPAAGLLLLAAAVAIWVPSRRALRLNR